MKEKHRYFEKTKNPDVTIYKMRGGVEYDSEITPLVDQCRQIVGKIQEWAERLPNVGWSRKTQMERGDKQQLWVIKEKFKKAHDAGGRGGKNIIKHSRRTDKTVGFGKDNRVFDLQRFPKVVYKESSQPASQEELLYLRRKYSILKTYLGDSIPQTRFILGEVNRPTQITKWMEDVDIPQMSIVTLQRKVQGQSLQKMPKNDKKNEILLKSLEKEHRKYILLKMFVRKISEELWLPPDTIDVKMDIGPLSDMDQFDTQDPISIRKNLISPNIMFDSTRVHFVDLDFGKWDEEKQRVFEVLMNPETIQRWDEVLGSFWLSSSLLSPTI